MRPVHLPRTMDDLWSILRAEPDTGIYAGGTDVLVLVRRGLSDPPSFTCLERIETLRGVEEQGDRLVIGACTPYSELLSHASIAGHFPVLAEAMNVLGSPHIRNMGTMGGNIITASPAGDCLPPLYILEAELELLSERGARRVPVSRFIKGPGLTDLAPGEILAGIGLKKEPRYNVHHYEKVGKRKALSCSIVSLAAMIDTDESGMIEDARLAWGSVGPTVVRFPEAEDVLRGRPLSRETLIESAQAASESVRPIDDVRGSAEYRRLIAGNLVMRLMRFAAPSHGIGGDRHP